MEGTKRDNPFEIFPKEIWEMILDQVEDSDDIQYVLVGLPRLDVSINRRKRYWLIGQILPCLNNLLDFKDVLNLRRVCKQWQQRTDHFLQNQPYFRPYSEDRSKQILRSDLAENLKLVLRNLWLHYSDHRVHTLPKILNHSENRNPFVLRMQSCEIIGLELQKKKHIRNLVSVFERFGTHLWYLKIYLQFKTRTVDCFYFLKFLHACPNLKSLWIQRWDQDLREPYPVLNLDLPKLPFLESLEFESAGFTKIRKDLLGRKLIMRYGPQIRRLTMPVDNWRGTLMQILFPCLTELYLHVNSGDKRTLLKRFALLRTILSTISCPKLVKLQIILVNREVPISVSVEDDILKWLKRFSRIKYFGITNENLHWSSYTNVYNQQNKGFRLVEKGTADPVRDSIPSLQTLKLFDGHALSYNFLRCFPSLQNLEIDCYSTPSVFDFGMENSFANLKVAIQSGKLYESNIWEVLGKLRNIELTTFLVRKIKYLYFRWDYDQLKKKDGGHALGQGQMNGFRKDIENFLRFRNNLRPLWSI